jgi:hypothetical protein
MTEFRSMQPEQIEKVQKLEDEMLKMPQVELPIHHHIHGGLYARTAFVPAGVAFTGALIKIPTTVIICGDVTVYIGEQSERLQGYHVIAAEEGRKQAFVAHSETVVTMLFPTDAKTPEEAEEAFTDAASTLQSRRSNLILSTEIQKCLA